MLAMAAKPALRAAGRIAAGALLVLAAGCSTVELPGIRSEGAVRKEGGIVERPAMGKSSGMKPMPLRTFTVSTECKFKDEAGNFGNAKVDVLNSKVRALNVVMTMPKRGSCRYDLAQFRQTQALPSIELAGARDCKVRMWEQGEQITVAFAGCHHLCSPSSAHDYVWPLLIDKPTGQCD